MTLLPYEAIADDAWQRLERAADQRGDPHRLCAFATIDREGRPDVRLLVLRGAERASARLWFHTDRRSGKIASVKANPAASLVTYDPVKRVQLRVHGGVRLHEDDEISQRHWEQLDMAVRLGFGAETPPGEAAPHPDPRMEAQQADVESGQADAGRENLAVIVLDVEKIDWLELGELRHRRAVMHKTDDWTVWPLQP